MPALPFPSLLPVQKNLKQESLPVSILLWVLQILLIHLIVKVLPTSPSIFLMVPRLSEPNLSFFKCSHNLPRWLDPAACTQEPAKLETLLARGSVGACSATASANTTWNNILCNDHHVELRSAVFTGPAVLPVTLTWLNCGRKDCHRSLLTRAMCSTVDTK